MKVWKLWKLDAEGDALPVIVAEGSYADCCNALLALGETLTYDRLHGWWEVKPDGINPTAAYVIV